MITPIQQQLLRQLSDGAVHSGTALGEVLGISRAAVWKQIQSLQEANIEIISEQRQGYRLPYPVALLDQQAVADQIDAKANQALQCIETVWSCDSTNSELMRRVRDGCESGTVLLAEYQLVGRGRRGKQWVSPFGKSLYLSLTWRFSGGPVTLSGLGIVAGIAAAKAVQQLGLEAVRLKWPNDLHVEDQKLGGVLIELEGESEGPTDVVIGMGVNVQRSTTQGLEIDQPWTALSDHLDPPSSRNQLAAEILNQLVPLLEQFEQQGMASLLPEWDPLDRVSNRQVDLQMDGKTITGIARGIDASGALKLESNGEIQRHFSGDLSLRFHANS